MARGPTAELSAAPKRAAPATVPPPELPRLASTVVRWQRAHGRQHLPWQNTRDPYRVWLSEVMLQQTQVSTVLDYFQRFLAAFPDVAALAAAPHDAVMGLWSGLGYYSRARHLHRCAQEVVALWGGAFPTRAADLQTLPGIGRSTAAAIAAFCFDERVAILDGNVRRVLTRVLAYDADLSGAAHERRLWDIAQALLPTAGRDMPAYTQGLMDLGATVCTSRAPQCESCPLQRMCAGRRDGSPERFPVKTRRVQRQALSLWLLWLTDARGRVWLSQRPAPGVWAGLYCLPLFDGAEAVREPLGTWAARAQDLPTFKHVLTHRDLHLHPVRCLWTESKAPALDGRWVEADAWPSLGLPAPVRQLLQSDPLTVV